MLKRDEIANPNSCLNKAADDEPIFVIRAQDLSSGNLVRKWADAAETYGASAGKVAEARALADLMDVWPTRKFPD